MKKILISMMLVATLLVSCTPQETTDNYSDSDTETNNVTTQEMTKTSEMRLIPEKGDTIAKMQTNMGELSMLLYTDLAPKTTENFIELAKAGKYDGVIFHRVMDNFMIQGGDFENGDGTGGYTFEGPGTSLKDEFGEGLEHVYGAVSMANAGKNTGGSQFFIVQKKDGTPWLDGRHAIFGYVYEGMDTVEKITDVETDAADRPLEDVVIEGVEIAKY